MRSCHQRLANRKKLFLPLEKYFKTKFLSHLQFFKVGKIMVSKYGHLMLPGTFTDKITPHIDFTDEAVVQCDVPVVKILL